MKDHISNTKPEKSDHYYIQTRHKDLFFPLKSYSKKNLRKKYPGKRSKIQTKGAHSPWASKGSNPVQAWIFFQAFFSQLQKLRL